MKGGPSAESEIKGYDYYGGNSATAARDRARKGQQLGSIAKKQAV
jgi:hypothetical protein